MAKKSSRGRRAPSRSGNSKSTSGGGPAAGIARTYRRDLSDVTEALGIEALASAVAALWRPAHAVLDRHPQVALEAAVVAAVEAKADARSLEALRALALVDAEGTAGAAANRLATTGLPEPAWSKAVEAWAPARATLLREDVFNEGYDVFVEFEGETPHVLGVHVDRNCGENATDIMLTGDLEPVRRLVAAHATDQIGLEAISLSEARARIERALAALTMTVGVPEGETLAVLRLLLLRRLTLLPDGHGLPAPTTRGDDEREALVEAFLATDEGRRFGGDDDARDLLALAVDFAEDHIGDALRWSPAVIECFTTDWLPRKVIDEPGFFERVADVLPPWVRHAGRVRGVPAADYEEASAVVWLHLDELREAVADPEAWGLAKSAAIGGDSGDAALDERMQELMDSAREDDNPYG